MTLCESMKVTQTSSGILIKFNKDNETIGSVKFSLDTIDKIITLWTWSAKKGYGRKILICLLNTLTESKMMSKNMLNSYVVMGYIKPLHYTNKNNFSKKEQELIRIYTKMGFNINKNGHFEQSIKKLTLLNK